MGYKKVYNKVQVVDGAVREVEKGLKRKDAFFGRKKGILSYTLYYRGLSE